MIRAYHTPLAMAALVALVLSACAPPPAPPAPAGSAPPSQDQTPRRVKSLTVGVIGNAEGFGLAGSGGPTTGGWATASEVHSNGLITSEDQSRKPAGQVAAAVPTIE